MIRIITSILLFFFYSDVFAQSQYLDPTFGNGGIMTNIPQVGCGYRMTTIDSGRFLAITRKVAGLVKEDGTLDSSYFGRGYLNYSFFTDHPTLYWNTSAFRPDGKIIMSGTCTSPVFSNREDIVTIRLNADYSVDSSFSDSGYVTRPAPGFDEVAGVGVQSDGKIVLGAEFDGGNVVGLIRYTSDGRRDSSFGTNSEVHFRTGRYDMDAVRMFILTDDRILLGGNAYRDSGGIDFLVMRFQPNGQFDSSFGINGRAFADLNGFGGYGFLNDMALQADGKIVLCGGSYQHDGFHLVRMNADGSRDFSFNRTGESFFSVNGSGSATQLGIQDDRKIFVCGFYGANEDLAIVRIHPDGRFDSSFGNNGIIEYSEPGKTFNRDYRMIISRGNRPQVSTTRGPANSNVGRECVTYRFKPYGTTAATGEDPKIGFRPSLFVFPNPAQHSVTLCSDKKFRSVIAVDAGGKSVPLNQVSSTENTYDVGVLSAGTYVLQCRTGNEQPLSARLVVAGR